MKDNVREIFNVFDDVSKYLAVSKAPIETENLNEIFAKIYSPGP